MNRHNCLRHIGNKQNIWSILRHPPADWASDRPHLSDGPSDLRLDGKDGNEKKNVTNNGTNVVAKEPSKRKGR